MATAQSGYKAIKRAAANPLLELLERLGYVARSALEAVMGLLAVGVAVGVGGSHATDLAGSLVFLIGNPFGNLVLIAFSIGLAAYSLWGFVRAIYDHCIAAVTHPATRRGLVVTSALSYAAVVIFALQILGGSLLLVQPFGRILLGVIALGFVALGLHSFACALDPAAGQRSLTRNKDSA